MIFALQTIDPGVVDELIDTTNVTGWDYLWALITVVTAFVLAWIAKKALRRGLKAFDGIPPRIASMITTATTWSIRLLGVVFALPFLGVDIGPVVIFIIVILALLIVAGRVILENFGAGLILQTRAPFKVGDEIASLEYSGRVEDINGRSVVIKSDSGERVAIPNLSVLSNPIVTLTAHQHRRSELVVGVKYGTDLDRTKRVLEKAVTAAAGVAADPPAEAYVIQYADSSIDFLVRFWHASNILSGFTVTDEVGRAVNRSLKEHGIVIAFPQRTLWWGEGGQDERPEEV